MYVRFGQIYSQTQTAWQTGQNPANPFLTTLSLVTHSTMTPPSWFLKLSPVAMNRLRLFFFFGTICIPECRPWAQTGRRLATMISRVLRFAYYIPDVVGCWCDVMTRWGAGGSQSRRGLTVASDAESFVRKVTAWISPGWSLRVYLNRLRLHKPFSKASEFPISPKGRNWTLWKEPVNVRLGTFQPPG